MRLKCHTTPHKNNFTNITSNGTAHLKSHALRSGKYKLVHHFNTSDFELYDLESDLMETTNLLSQNESHYADMVKEMYFKLKADGPCPEDKRGHFTLSGGELSGSEVKCSWFRKKEENRCEHYHEGRLFCPSACASRNTKNICQKEKHPPILPASYTNNCTDSTLPYIARRMKTDDGKKRIIMKTCEKIGANACRKRGVASHCPSKCEKCSEYRYVDSKKEFRVEKKLTSCKRISLTRCEDPAVQISCRASCDSYQSAISN